MRLRSSSSLTIWTRWPVSTSILAIRSRIFAGIVSPTVSASRCSVSDRRLTVVSGVRSSCDRLSMNSVRMRWSRRSSETSSRTSHRPPPASRRPRTVRTGPSGPADRTSPADDPASSARRASASTAGSMNASITDRSSRAPGGWPSRTWARGLASRTCSVASRRTTPVSRASRSTASSADRSDVARSRSARSTPNRSMVSSEAPRARPRRAAITNATAASTARTAAIATPGSTGASIAYQPSPAPGQRPAARAPHATVRSIRPPSHGRA